MSKTANTPEEIVKILTDAQFGPDADSLPNYWFLLSFYASAHFKYSQVLCKHASHCNYGSGCWLKHDKPRCSDVGNSHSASPQLFTHSPYQIPKVQEHGEPPPLDSHQTNSAGTVPAPTAKHTGPIFNHNSIFSALQDRNAAMQSQDSSQSNEAWITPKKRHREKRTVDPDAQHNSPSEQIKVCGGCNAHFTLSDETQAWFHDRGLQSAAHCQACRLCRKHNIAAGTGSTTPLIIRQTTSAPRSVTNETSYASIASAAKSSLEPNRLTTGNLLKINEKQININNEQPSDGKAATKEEDLTNTEPSIHDLMHTIPEAS